MPEPFKTFFSVEKTRQLATLLAPHVPEFDADAFVADAAGRFEEQELKERSNAIRDALIAHLPTDPAAFRACLLAVLAPEGTADPQAFGAGSAGVHGWMISPMADAIAATGQSDLDGSMAALEEMTKRFTAEFAVRPFLKADPDRALDWHRRWAAHGNLHVRRLASEGCRPRLPWGMRLNAFVTDPAPLMPILTALRDDPEEYVRRSVANNLNDIAKDHPDLVADLARDWLKDASHDRTRLVRHACRTLIKAGHPGALAAFGYEPPRLEVTAARASTAVTLGDRLDIDLTLRSTAKTPQKIVLDFAIHFRKANGSLSPKVFKWTELTLAPGGEHSATKAHPIRPVTTRRYYPGTQKVVVQANGQDIWSATFALTIPD